MALKTYRGNCHCAAFVFEATIPENTKAELCNCSNCYKKGAVWAMIPNKDNFTIAKGDLDKAKDYRFASKNFSHKFCPTCGTALLFTGHLPGDEKEHMGVNVGTPARSLLLNMVIYIGTDPMLSARTGSGHLGHGHEHVRYEPRGAVEVSLLSSTDCDGIT